MGILEYIKNGDLQSIHREIALDNYKQSKLSQEIFTTECEQNSQVQQEFQSFLDLLFEAPLNSIKYFIKKYDIDIDTQGLCGKTALIHAAIRNNLEIVEYLIQNNANVHIKDENSYTALMWAALLGNQEIAIYLINNGARYDDTDDFGNTPMILAVGYLDLVEKLLHLGADINTQNHNGFSILMWASNSLESVKFLIDRGADINIRNIDGKNILILSAEQGALDVVKYLIQKGMDENFTCYKGFTALMGAAHEGHLDIVRYFIEELHMDASQTDDTGKNACMWALTNHQNEVALYLENFISK